MSWGGGTSLKNLYMNNMNTGQENITIRQPEGIFSYHGTKTEKICVG